MTTLQSLPLVYRGKGLGMGVVAVVALCLAGCAKFPGGGATGGNTQVKFSMTVAGRNRA